MKIMRFTVVIVFLTTLILLVDLVYCGHPENTSPENDHIVEWDGVIISDRVEGYISTENGHYDEVDGEDSGDDDEDAGDDFFFNEDYEEEESSMKISPGEDSVVVDVAGADLGVPQILTPTYADKILEKLEEGRNYFSDFILPDTANLPVQKICKNKHQQCGFWAVLGGKQRITHSI